MLAFRIEQKTYVYNEKRDVRERESESERKRERIRNKKPTRT